MADLTLVIGNKNLSSWSMRPWLALTRTGVDFDEHVIPLNRPETRATIPRHSPSGKVPVLRHGDRVIWESLAICEYIAELYPEALLWPEDMEARAMARAVSAEMHAGFGPLRSHLPMDVRARRPAPDDAPGVADDVARILQLWEDCRARFGAGGPFLCGSFSIADAMYAPVVSRFRTYGVALDGVCRDYAEAVWALPDVQRWVAGAEAEP